jgi:excisionase family DNA binding protein
MLTPKQVAERTGVSVSLVYRWCQEGLLEVFRLGGKGRRGKLLIVPSSLDQFLESCKQQPQVAVPLRHIKL